MGIGAAMTISKQCEENRFPKGVEI